MFRKKSRLFWGCALLVFFIVDLILLWKVGIVSLGELDTYRDMKLGQSKDEVFKKPKEALEDKKLEKNERAMQTRESKSDKGSSRKNSIQNDHGLNCVCKDCLSSKKARGSLYPINQ